MRFRGLCFHEWSANRKIILAMNLTAIILLNTCLVAGAKGFSQGINLSEKNAALTDVFKKIERQTGYTFAYTGSQLNEAKKITVEISNGTLEEVLNLCFKDQPFTYTIIEKTIVVKPKPQRPNLTTTNEPGPPVDISGKVTDADGNPLTGAYVTVKGTNNGTTTDGSGFFLLKALDENSVLEISFVGFVTQAISIKNKTSITLSLKRSESKLDEVQIIAYGQTTQRLNTGDVSTVKAADIQKQPVANPLLALEGRVPGLFIT